MVLKHVEVSGVEKALDWQVPSALKVVSCSSVWTVCPSKYACKAARSAQECFTRAFRDQAANSGPQSRLELENQANPRTPLHSSRVP